MSNVRTPSGKLPYRMFDNPAAPLSVDTNPPRTQPRRLKTAQPQPDMSPTVDAGSGSNNAPLLETEK